MAGPADRSDVLARIRLDEVLTEEVGPPKTSGAEAWWASVEPGLAGTGKTPPTHIYKVDADGVEHFKDFASGRSGTAIDVLMIRRGVDFATALEALAARAGLTSTAPLPPPLPKETKVPAEPQAPTAGFHDWVEFCAAGLWAQTPGAARARDWLASRGYREELIREWNVGFDPGERSTAAWPKAKRGRNGIPNMGGVVFPMFNRDRIVVYAQTRNLDWTSDSRYPKYVNLRGVTNPRIGLWARNETLAGAPVVVVEGPTDALAVRQGGLSAVGLIGAGHAANPATAAALIDTFGDQRPFVVMTDYLTANGDIDNAGRLAGQWLVTNLWTQTAPAVYRPPTSPGDISDWLRSRGPTFTTELSDHVSDALSVLTATTQRLLAGDDTFIELAAGGPLTAPVATAWEPNNPPGPNVDGAVRPQARKLPTPPELTI